ncbi:RNA polymerase sigma-70 factor, ECF subfamily [Chitinophaga costaii]|uniref:RNA polymerase sigma-70 factor, ECF subfamily n=1 Tax=Chitinophaga costaii TaxID=1335309 RepID=A0A1C4AV42_9BACT|nr:RNA polymerase sigma-70 factor [Chitinophaga costaii]PUZ26759.1 RNA polymerase sigma-70 factor [Chitinophaga costaii]SCB98505.1 RNA polymerase sigma-70 factor, ECF subfamily [Chitinophaga costaii]
MRVSSTVLQQPSDELLFKLVKQDNRKAFEEIYARHWPTLVTFACSKVASQHKAEDMVQDIFISLYKRRHLIDFNISLKSYLNKSLKFKILNEYRSQSVRKNYLDTASYHQDTFNTMTAVELKELTSGITRSIEALPQKCREAFLLSRSQELSHKDISRSMGISVSTVEKHIVKALKHIKQNLPA